MEEALSLNPYCSEEESTDQCSGKSHNEESIAENVETLLTEFIDDLIDVEVCLDKNFPKLQQFGIISLENWRDAFYSTKDLNLRNKIIQLVYKHFFHKSNTKNRILIHCSMGVSRSPTVAIMYIMKKFQLSFEDAHSLILLHREKSDPIDSFLDELRLFAQQDFNFLNE
jgi:protein tyrosine phosphatase